MICLFNAANSVSSLSTTIDTRCNILWPLQIKLLINPLGHRKCVLSCLAWHKCSTRNGPHTEKITKTWDNFFVVFNFLDHIVALDYRVTRATRYRLFCVGRVLEMPPVKSYEWISCTVLVANINIGLQSEGCIMGWQYLYWQTGTDVDALTATAIGPFFFHFSPVYVIYTHTFHPIFNPSNLYPHG